MVLTQPCHDCGNPVRRQAEPGRWLCGTCSASPPRAAPDLPEPLGLMVAVTAASLLAAAGVGAALANAFLRRFTR